ncbi:MAG: exodeoxyribonuclease III [Patescibacteria group bacterium]|jgi:exodeoxyribonuclease-3
MKIISWNVNGIRAVAKKGFGDFLRRVKPDILCLQEIKISVAAIADTEFDFAGYKEYWNPALRPGYSGTAILVREDAKLFKALKEVNNGFDSKKSDLKKVNKDEQGQSAELNKFNNEGRVQTAELEKFYLLNVYFPNANAELSRLPYKLEFNIALFKYVKRLEKKKPVIITGDFNVAHEEIDLARPKENEGSAGFTAEERDWLDKFLSAGFIDTFRVLNGDKIQYSWWSFRAAARARNVGWRIDYFCASAKLKRMIKKAYILDKVMGSDHAPVGIEL